MKNMKHIICGVLMTGLLATRISNAAEEPVLRLGHFPNITHAQAVMARASGSYEKALGGKIEWVTFNAGPSAIEAIFAGAIDATYIGPNPAINGFIKSKGAVFAIVAGSASGGAALVVRPDSGISSDKDFDGKIIATPQLGNTQDVAARAWFTKKGYRFKEKGGRLTIQPLANPDQLTMFLKKEIDGAWTVEPWVTRLIIEGKGKVFLEEKDLWPQGRYVTTHLIVSKKFMREHPDRVEKLIRAHIEMTRKINADKNAAIPVLNQELQRETGKALPESIISGAFQRVEFTWDPIESSLHTSARDAYTAGFFKTEPDLNGIYDLSFLNKILRDMKLP